MTGFIDVGGGMRGIYGAGILDYCLENGINFDLCTGISAGAANVTSFVSKQQFRNYRFYHEYSFREEYMGIENFFKTGSFINFDYIYDTLSRTGGEDAVDFESFTNNPTDVMIIATDAETGMARYFKKEEIKKDSYEILKASCCIPGINKPIYIDGKPYFDGALSDTVPLKKVFSEGCDRIVLVLTKPLETERKVGKDAVLAKMIEFEYPDAARRFLNRADRYNLSVKLARQLQDEGKVLILAPESIEGVDTLKRDKDALDNLYNLGYKDGEKIKNWI